MNASYRERNWSIRRTVAVLSTSSVQATLPAPLQSFCLTTAAATNGAVVASWLWLDLTRPIATTEISGNKNTQLRLIASEQNPYISHFIFLAFNACDWTDGLVGCTNRNAAGSADGCAQPFWPSRTPSACGSIGSDFRLCGCAGVRMCGCQLATE